MSRQSSDLSRAELLSIIGDLRGELCELVKEHGCSALAQREGLHRALEESDIIIDAAGEDCQEGPQDQPSSEFRAVDQDTVYLGPFGTVRACRHCGVLVSGGPTACVCCVMRQESQANFIKVLCPKCEKIFTANREAVKMHGYSVACPHCFTAFELQRLVSV